MKRISFLAAAVLVLAGLAQAQRAGVLETVAVGTVPGGINFQGRLENNGSPVTGTQQMVFNLYDSASGGNLLWTSPTLSVNVQQGIFAAVLNIPVGALSGPLQKYLEVQVQGTTLSPREPLRAVPYALIARTVEGTLDISTAGFQVSAQGFSQPILFVSTITGNVGINTGNPTTKLNVVDGDIRISTVASVIRGIFFPDGSYQTSAGVGSASSVSNNGDVIINSNNGRIIMRTAGADDLIMINGGAVGIGVPGAANTLDIGGGGVLLRSSITLSGMAAPVVSGAGRGAIYFDSTANKFMVSENGGAYTALVGFANLLNSTNTWSAQQNFLNELTVSSSMAVGTTVASSTLTVAGFVESTRGGFKFPDGTIQTTAGGGGANLLNSTNTWSAQQTYLNQIAISSHVILTNAGIFDVGSPAAVPVPSGAGTRFMWIPSSAAIRAGAVGGTEWDPANIGPYSVAFGTGVIASAAWSTVIGGQANTASGQFAFVGGGQANTASANNAAVGGGFSNRAIGSVDTIGGGQNNTASGGYSTVGGGLQNTAGGQYSVAPGGYRNVASGQYSFVAGQQAQATAQGSFLWADSQNTPLVGGTTDQFLVRAQGGFYVNSSSFTLLSQSGTFYIQNNGFVGLGTTSPSDVLTIQNGFLRFNTALTGIHWQDGSVSTTASNGGGGGGIGGLGTAGRIAEFTGASNIGNSPITDNGGNIGISTGSPATLLDVNGTASFGSGATKSTFTASGNLQLVSGSTISSNGSLSLSTAASAALTGTPAVFVSNSGFMGIGTTVPSSTLTVAGLVESTKGGYKFPDGSIQNTAAGVSSLLSSTNTWTAQQTHLNEVFFSSHVAINNAALWATGAVGSPAVSGAGTELLWIPSSASIRAGAVVGTQWDPANIGPYSVAFGSSTQANGVESVVGGGMSNTASGQWAIVGGGSNNTATNTNATVAGGNTNAASAISATVGGGLQNTASGTQATVSGGNANTASAINTTVAGGASNVASAISATVGGGFQNAASAGQATVGGGNTNAAGGAWSTVSGGSFNTATGQNATVPGGASNSAFGAYSFAAGQQAIASAKGSFLWADSQAATLFGSTTDQFLVRAQGGFYVNSASFTLLSQSGTFYIQNNGFVGVGTAAPSSTLTVVGLIEAQQGGVKFPDGTVQNTAFIRTSVINSSLTIINNNPADSYTIAVTTAPNRSVYHLYVATTGMVGIGTSAPDNTLSVNGSADKPGGGSWGTFSDARLKNVRGIFDYGLKDILRLQPVRYRYRQDNPLGLRDEGEHIGLVAQEVQKAIPDAVYKNDKGYLILNNDPIIWAMLNAIRELNQVIKTQEAEISTLKGELAGTKRK